MVCDDFQQHCLEKLQASESARLLEMSSRAGLLCNRIDLVNLTNTLVNLLDRQGLSFTWRQVRPEEQAHNAGRGKGALCVHSI